MKERLFKGIVKPIVRFLVNLWYKKYPFLVYSWGIDEHTDIHIMTEESYLDRHRFGVREEFFGESEE